MNSEFFSDLLRNLETTELLRQVQRLQAGDLVHNPWVLGAVGILALLALLLRWKVVLVTILGITGFAWLTDYTLKRQTTIDQLNSETLLVFAGGGITIVMLVIYLLFIRNE